MVATISVREKEQLSNQNEEDIYVSTKTTLIYQYNLGVRGCTYITSSAEGGGPIVKI